MSNNDSARLGLPYLAAGQLQKHVTLNEALTRLDGLVQTRVVSRSVAVQPASPADGALYILPAGATGLAWATYAAGDLVRAELGAWTVVPAPDGLLAWVANEGLAIVRHAGTWMLLGEGLGRVQGLTRLGLNTTADATNPFAARLNKALWTAVTTGDGGDGDLRLTFNKETAGDVLSLLFQSGYGGRAELGLIGDDDLTLKVSADGSSWTTALTVSRTSGAASFPAGCGRAETTVFTANGTYAVPAWARMLEAVAVGAGAGGGSGAAGASGANRFGGGGGGAGGFCSGAWPVSHLAGSLTVLVGTGGAGGAGSTGVGANGVVGGVSSIASAGVTLLSAKGGVSGQGGTAAAGLGGAGGVGVNTGNKGGDSSVVAVGGVGGSTDRPDGSGGGGGGGGLTTANVIRAGGAGGQGGLVVTTTSGGVGGSGAVGGPGPAATTANLCWASGGGGGGGASVTTGYAGGLGGPGGGGGGGGAGVTASGAGGAGGRGLVRIVAIG